MSIQPGGNDRSGPVESGRTFSRAPTVTPLDQVVQETMRQIEQATPSGDLLPHLRGVAVALPADTPFSREVIEQFVEPVVRTVLTRWSPPPGYELSRRITREIAEALSSNPEASVRLEILWDRLRRETRT